MNDHAPEVIRATLDVVSFGTLLGWLVGALPALATALTIVWTALRIYETETVQKWIKRRAVPDRPE